MKQSPIPNIARGIAEILSPVDLEEQGVLDFSQQALDPSGGHFRSRTPVGEVSSVNKSWIFGPG